jgi:hypothetical protein
MYQYYYLQAAKMIAHRLHTSKKRKANTLTAKNNTRFGFLTTS